MLEHLKVSNVALIEEAAIEFVPGLNILTGETGAGKSILIDSINFVLGSRTPKDFIRMGADIAQVEAFLTISHPELVEQITRIGVEIDEDNALFILRSQNTKGKSVCKINGRSVTIGMLREVAAMLIDIHGQHEHQSLLSTPKHIQLLDRFCEDSLQPKKIQLAEHISAYRSLQKNINALSGEGEDRAFKIEMYQFQIKEIEEANLSIDKEEELLARKKLLINAEKLTYNAAAAVSLLGSEEGALDNIARALEHAENLGQIDESMQKLSQELASIHVQLEELSRDFSRYSEDLEHNPSELDDVEQNLDRIYKLKQKYGPTVSHILEYYNEIAGKLNTIENSREILARLSEEKKALEKEIGRTCLAMSKIRKDAAAKLAAEIEAVLWDLGMESARFIIDIQTRNEFGPNGFDRVEFMISANKGEELKPLAAIASGGEMSRVMLALKTALAGFDTIETFIFDEIDAGISGRTAQQVAEKLSIIGKEHQILCITHLPQIAAMGDANFLIEKNLVGERTITNVEKLTNDGIITEIARLIGGAEITGTTTKAAKEMRKLAKKTKQP